MIEALQSSLKAKAHFEKRHNDLFVNKIDVLDYKNQSISLFFKDDKNVYSKITISDQDAEELCKTICLILTGRK
jgi:hypothetical protein